MHNVTDLGTDIKDVDLLLKPEIASDETKLESIHDMATVVVNWHHKITCELEHMCTIPDGAQVEYAHEEDPSKITKVILTGDSLIAYRLGVITALNAIDSLPFRATVTEPEPSENAAG